MEQPGDTEALRDRLSRLSEASLRINESLDPDTVLQEVMDNARALTGASFGAITTLDGEGGLLDFITSGLSPEEREVMLALSEGPRLFEYFSSVQGPLRLRDAAEHTRALGFPEGQPPVGSLMGTPMRHQGEHVGNLYVAEKEGGGEFTPEDEETLVMFASQAALVVSNARRYRDERRARTGLEALVNTSPVGVLVFDARTGTLTSINREARRIVSGLCMPGGSAEQLLEVLSFRRADGREVSLEEFPLAEALSTGEAVRAEEIVIQAPDGRSVAALVNATPIRSEQGEVESPVESVVVTLQDLTPLEEMERLRAEFLGMVSHELRTPLSTIKGSATTLLEAASDLDPAEMLQFFRIINQQADYMRDLIGDLLDVARIETGTLPVAAGIVEVAVLVDEARNMFLRGGGRDNLRIDLPPDLPLVMADRRRIVQVLNNLLSNASRNSPESSAIRVSAVVADFQVAVSVADDGVGISAERLPRLFRKFSPMEGNEGRRDLEGSGLGLAICKGIVEAHGGRIWAESDGPGLGALFTFTLPVAQEGGTGAAARPAQPSARLRQGKRKQQRVLVVDDDPQTLRYVRDCPLESGLRAGGDRRPGGGAPPHRDEQARPGPAGPDAAGDRRDRADAEHPGAGRPAGHLPVRLRPGRGHRQGLRAGRRRLRGQALLAHGVGGQDQGGPAGAGGPGPGRAVGTPGAGRPHRQLPGTQGVRGRPSGASDRHRVRAAGRAFAQPGTGGDPRSTAAAGLGRGTLRRRPAGAGCGEAAPPQAGRRLGQPHLHLHRAPCRLPHGAGGGAGLSQPAPSHYNS